MKLGIPGSRRLAVLAAFAAGNCLSVPWAAGAQSLESFRFEVDNDAFDFWLPSQDRPDDNYTHGEVMRAVFNTAPRWARGQRPDCSIAQGSVNHEFGCGRSFFGITQAIFTPIDDSPTPLAGHRPYAGLLVAELGRQIVEPRAARTLAIRIGTTGYASGAQATQKAFHRLTDQRRPEGWSYQVAGQPIIGLTYGSQYLLNPPPRVHASVIALVASGSATAGTVQSDAKAGLGLKAGYKVPHPWMPASEREGRAFRVYLILEGSEKWVAQNVLIEGNSPQTRGLVRKRPFVFESVWGIAAGLGGYSVEYRAVSHSREYETEPTWHRWGTISIIKGTP